MLGSLCVILAAEAQEALWNTATLQAALDRQGFGVGLIDNVEGRRTQSALADYCQAYGLGETEARAYLMASSNRTWATHTITSNDFVALGFAPQDWLEASAVERMAYTSLLEYLSEQYHVSQPFLRRLNPRVGDWARPPSGTALTVPNTTLERPLVPATLIEIDANQYRLRVFDATHRLVASFPCSIARTAAAVLFGEWRIVAAAPNPIYVFDPANFPDTPRAQEIGRKLILPAGPNNPVGVYWFSLNRPGFGIHGTPSPETIGRAESRGCFRLTNWDVQRLSTIVAVGTPVRVIYSGTTAASPDERRPPL